MSNTTSEEKRLFKIIAHTEDLQEISKVIIANLNKSAKNFNWFIENLPKQLKSTLVSTLMEDATRSIEKTQSALEIKNKAILDDIEDSTRRNIVLLDKSINKFNNSYESVNKALTKREIKNRLFDYLIPVGGVITLSILLISFFYFSLIWYKTEIEILKAERSSLKYELSGKAEVLERQGEFYLKIKNEKPDIYFLEENNKSEFYIKLPEK